MNVSVQLLNNQKTAVTYASLCAGPFTVNVSAPCLGDYRVDLCAFCSRSFPYANVKDEKKLYLIPTWKFLDLSGNFIESIDITNTIIYDASSNPIGITGSAQFYYQDDMPTNGFYICKHPVYIQAALTHLACTAVSGCASPCCNLNPGVSSDGFNTDVAAVWINGWIPDNIKITRNGIDPILDKWVDLPINWYVTLHSSYALSGWGIDPIVFGYPAYGQTPVTTSLLSGICSLSSDNCPDPMFIYTTSNLESRSGGLANGVYTSYVSALSASISATVPIEAPDYDLVDFVNVWISNPNNKSLTIGQRIPQIVDPDLFSNYSYSELCQYLNNIENLSGVGPVFYSNQYPMPYLTALPGGDVMGLTGFGGIYGFAVYRNFLGNVEYAWATDGELDTLYKINASGVLLSTIQLAEGSTPAGIALDGSLNMVYYTLFDEPSVWQYNISADSYNCFTYGESALTGSGPIHGIDYIRKPPVVDTDVENYAWVAYSNTLSSFLVKLEPTALSAVVTVIFDTSATPVDVLVQGSDNSVWVSLPYSHIPNTSAGKIQQYDSSGNFLQEVTGIDMPGYLTIDRYDRIWYTYDVDKVGCISPWGETFNFTISNSFGPVWLELMDENGEQNLEGIACDLNNVLWILDSRENYAYTFNLNLLHSPASGFSKLKIIPDENLEWYNDGTGITAISSEFNKSAQAFCDWTGYRWYQKYYSNQTALITGESNVFNIKPVETPFELRKFNDSWDATEQIRQYAIAPHMNSFYNLWENFVGGAVGGVEPGQQIGRRSYERIANFVQNHSDVDDCNLAQLYSLAQYLDVPIDNYNFNYPSEVRRLMDLLSISHSELWGEWVKCNMNITNNNICPRCGNRHSNLGERIVDPLSYMITAGVPFVLHNTFNIGQYAWDLVTPVVSGDINSNIGTICIPSTGSSITGISSYPLSSLYFTTQFDLTSLADLQAYYEVYSYVSGFPDYVVCDPNAHNHVQGAGVINWSDDWTTLDRSESALDTWYNDTGLVEQLLEYELIRGLQITAACGLVEDTDLNITLKECNTAICINEPQHYVAYATQTCTPISCTPLSAINWYLNGSLIQSTTGDNSLSYMITAVSAVGLWDISAVAIDVLGNTAVDAVVLSANSC